MTANEALSGIKIALQRLFAALFCCSALLCCSESRSYNPTSPASRSAELMKDQVNNDVAGRNDETIDPLLLKALQDKYDVARLFAWAGSETDGRIMWVDKDGQLLSTSFAKSKTGFEIYQLDDQNSRRFRTMLNQQDLVTVSEYLSDTEFPVRVDNIETGDCLAQIILLWFPVQRSFTDEPYHNELARPGLRIVLRSESRLISNSRLDFEAGAPKEVLVDDVNGDGLRDYVFVTYVEPAIYIWTLLDSCLFRSLIFVEEFEGARDRYKVLEGRRVEIKRTEGAEYSIHVWSKVPFKTEYTEEIYKWDSREEAFVVKARRPG